MMSADEIRRRIETALGDAKVEVVDLTGTEDHYQATVTSARFRGLPLLDQHRLVYQALGDALGEGPIHALTLRTVTAEGQG